MGQGGGRHASTAPAEAVDAAEARLRAALSVCGHSCTAQRRAIFRELAACACHPTAEELYLRLRATNPDLSLATVYKSLHLFERLAVARAVATPDGKSRFDVPLRPHHHIRCVACGALEDLVDPRLDVPVPSDLEATTGFTALATEVLLSGYCRECRGRAAAATAAPSRGERSSAPGSAS